MEANEAQELQEHAEHGSHESSLRPVALTMTVLAVLVAVTSVLGHRTHTEAILNQDKATDTWNEYQAHKIRANDTKLTADLLSVVTVADKDAAKKLAGEYAKSLTDKKDETKDDMAKALDYEKKVEEAEAKGDRFDLAEALLEIGLVITSVTLLTRKRAYWYVGMVSSLGGIVSVISGLLLK
jgi:microcystin degradation protein MlrC